MRKRRLWGAWMAVLLLLLSAAAQAEGRVLIPGGQLVGVAVRSEGLIYVGASDLGQTPSPARLAGLKSGDVILTLNGQAVEGPAEFAGQVARGGSVSLGVMRAGDHMEFQVEPLADPRDGVRRIGAWVRSSAAGVGTLTYIDPRTGRFGALGHAIEDPDARVVIGVREGVLYESAITEVVKGKKGVPGQLSGDFMERNRPVGVIGANGSAGITGTYVAAKAGNPLFPQGIETGGAHAGAAQMLTAAADGRVGLYDIRILRVDAGADTRALAIEVIDPALIRATGGIVQGMSGSPIVQDGRLVGAVTHVLVDDPTRGYGILIERMLEEG